MNDLDYLRMGKLQRLLHNAAKFFRGIPGRLLAALKGVLQFFLSIFTGIGRVVKDIVMTYVRGDWKTRVSYTVMGFGSFMRGQWLRGLLFFVFQTVFNLYLWFFGIGYVSKLTTLGTVPTKATASGAIIYGDNSFLIMLYGVLTFFFIAAFFYTWYVNIKQNRISEEILKAGKSLKTARDDVASMLDGQFHKTLLALPTLGVAVFTILPIVFMILVAFTNYDKEHAPPTNLFTWVGTDNFETLLSTAESPLLINKSVQPDGTTTVLDITAKNGDKLRVYISPADEDKVEAAQEAILLPPATFPQELGEGDTFSFTGGKASRGSTPLTLVLPNGSELGFKTDKAQLEATEAALELVKLPGAACYVNIDAAAGTGVVTITATAADAQEPQSITLNVTSYSEKRGRDINAEFALEEIHSQAAGLHFETIKDGSVLTIVNTENGKTITAKLAADDLAKLESAQALLAAGGKMTVETEERQVPAAQGGEATTEEVRVLKAEGAGETVAIDLKNASEKASGRITFISSLGDEVALSIYDATQTQTPSMSRTFRQVLMWTLIWAFFATFLNYFLGMLVAIMINKKGIKLKKLWRTILVMTIAIPQFISLLYVSKMFAADGLVNGTLMSWGWIREPLPFWTNATWARVTIICINVWIGVPYLMLIATGILMNIPADLYESARIDGANAFQTYMKITLPYMLFVTGPYLLTSFTGNINNFNVIFLLSGGKPTSMSMTGNAGATDLLITWLYKMTVTDNDYKLAAVLGILVFVVCAIINLVVYNLIPSVKNEEDFQ